MGRTLAQELADRVANSHGFNKHIDDFNNPELGEPLNISTPQELENHVREILESQKTKSFTAFSTEQQWREADIFYHEPCNTMVIDPYDISKEPTAYRPSEGIAKFEEKLQEAERIEDREIPVVHGIQELHPEPELAEQKNSSTVGQEPESQCKSGAFTQMWENSPEWHHADIDNVYEHDDGIER